jgi:hypothetical protein
VVLVTAALRCQNTILLAQLWGRVGLLVGTKVIDDPAWVVSNLHTVVVKLL